MEKLLRKKPEFKKIIFNSAAPKISAAASVALNRALNQRRPFCSKDAVPVYFIQDMHQDIR